MMYVTQSVAPPATRHLSGPCLDPNWEFDRGKSVRVLLQVRVDMTASRLGGGGAAGTGVLVVSAA
jgi:hypothetical protein